MMAFVGMAMQGSADIGAMAPGIASALLTTVVGLIVAIPSVVGYNTIGAMIRQLTVTMDNFCEAFMVKLKLDEISKQDVR
jgi:biopolymer transport protein TolQ